VASVQIGCGELPRPLIAQAVIICRAAPSPTSMVVSFSARAWPPGRRSRVWFGATSSRSMSHAAMSIGPPNDT
jgi:hypothetical protein